MQLRLVSGLIEEYQQRIDLHTAPMGCRLDEFPEGSLAIASDLQQSTILVVQPDRDCGPDRIAAWALEVGANLEVCNPDTPDEMPASLSGYDGLLVLGGEMGDGDTGEYPWLEDVRELLREAHRLGMPTLGVCLGAQLLATALGGEVRPGAPGLEAGVIELEQTDDGLSDPLLAGVPTGFLSGAMHTDEIVRLPDTGVLLVTGETYPCQAFRCGTTWGVQFHPEVSFENYVKWVSIAAQAHPGMEAALQDTISEFSKLDPLVEPSCRRLVLNFFKAVQSATAGARSA